MLFRFMETHWILLCLIIHGHVVCQTDPCISYQNITDTSMRTDNIIPTACEYFPKSPAPVWIRYTANDGGAMATNCPGDSACGASGQIWINGTLPNYGEGTKSIAMCIKPGDGTGCCLINNYVRSKNCNSYFVFELRRPPNCMTRYCFNATATRPATVSTTIASTIPPTTTIASTIPSTTTIASTIPSTTTIASTIPSTTTISSIIPPTETIASTIPSTTTMLSSTVTTTFFTLLLPTLLAKQTTRTVSRTNMISTKAMLSPQYSAVTFKTSSLTSIQNLTRIISSNASLPQSTSRFFYIFTRFQATHVTSTNRPLTVPDKKSGSTTVVAVAACMGTLACFGILLGLLFVYRLKKRKRRMKTSPEIYIDLQKADNSVMKTRFNPRNVLLSHDG